MNKEKLYEAFGELIYAVAKADGVVQGEEEQKLKEVLEGHEWAEDIIWSFNYEKQKDNSLKEAYEKALSVIIEYGPYEEYPDLLKILYSVAEASDGIDDSERKLIMQFEADLERSLKIKKRK